MSSILEKIFELKELERNLFFEKLESENKISEFLIVLKYADDKSRELFLKGTPEPARIWLEQQMEEISEIEDGEIISAKTNLLAFFDGLDKLATKFDEDKEKYNKLIKDRRHVMKAGSEVSIDGVSDQMRGIKIPPIQKEYDKNAEIIDLPKYTKVDLKKSNIFDCFNDRKSRRVFLEEYISLEELSYLLWVTQGIRWISKDGKHNLRTVPSGGARHPFETYLAVNRVNNLQKGIYRYLPVEHKLIFLFTDEKLPENLKKLAANQVFVGKSAVCFIWSTIPYRMEWRYTLSARKDILIEAGHVCQNLYLACESIECGTCAIAAYNQEELDNFLNLDGEDEFVLYLAPVGRVKN
ncbi:MAG: SagB/ThcOx family dehydrogenase [Promethearchaeota archaeon]|jgi:SagB-type dehydrogenase family enzyme